MKKITLIIMGFILICMSVYAVNNSKKIYNKTLFNAVAIAGSGNSTSSAINLGDIGGLDPEGYFSFTLTTAGTSSVVKAEYLVCDTLGGTYYEPYGADDIVTAHSPGTVVYSFHPVIAKYMKIKLTETAGSNVTSATGIITIQ